ncbi:hypothetical protein B0H10DRAFT_436230 [Mycena sp. CBHHK59/15]|nr:hypothetical protein B0H10DRAFT_436230 [Mycena sp. CBHHK59/15]
MHCFDSPLATSCLCAPHNLTTIRLDVRCPMNVKILSFFACVCLLAIIPSSLGKETNASRLRRGLPPLPPRFIVRDKRATASATISSSPSSTPRPRFSGRIKVVAGNGTSLGYVRNSPGNSNSISPIGGVSLHADQDLRVRLAYGRELFDVVAMVCLQRFEPKELRVQVINHVCRTRTSPSFLHRGLEIQRREFEHRQVSLDIHTQTCVFVEFSTMGWSAR